MCEIKGIVVLAGGMQINQIGETFIRAIPIAS